MEKYNCTGWRYCTWEETPKWKNIIVQVRGTAPWRQLANGKYNCTGWRYCTWEATPKWKNIIVQVGGTVPGRQPPNGKI